MNFSCQLKPVSVFYIRREWDLIRATVLAAVFLFTLSVLFLLFIFSIVAFNINFIYFIFYEDFYFCGLFLLVYLCPIRR